MRSEEHVSVRRKSERANVMPAILIGRASLAKRITYCNVAPVIALFVAPWIAISGDVDNVDQKLLEAATRGNLGEVKSLLDTGAHANAADERGMTALIGASRAGDLEMVSLLLEKGADVNARTITGWTALIGAAGSNNYEVIALLLKKGAQTDLRAQDGATAVTEAIKNTAIKSASLLLDHAPHAMGRDAWDSLKWPLWQSNVETLRLLLDKGLDPNLRTADGHTILMRAVSQSRPKASWFLALFGPSPVYPAGERDPDIVKLLLERGADVNAEANNGDTALKLAQKRGSKAIIEFLKAHGAKE